MHRLALTLTLFSLACGSRYRAPVTPETASPQTLGPREARSIAGDPLWLVLPYAWDGTCAGPQATVEVAEQPDATVITLTQVSGCPITEHALASSLVRVGELAAGPVILRVGPVERTFEVLPDGSDPGPLDPSWDVRIAIARAHPPGECFGMPSPDGPSLQSVRESSPLLARQIRAAFPDQDPDVLVHLATRIDVVQRSADRWEYGYTDGGCCMISEMGGEVTRVGDAWQVSAPHAYEQRHVDC